LIIPPIIEDKAISDNIGHSLTTSLMSQLAVDVRYAGDIKSLKNVLTPDNLLVDGQINMGEATRVGKTLNANEVISVKINNITSYPPQQASAIVIVRTINGDKYSQRVSFVNVNMKDPVLKKEFAKFVGGSIRGPLGDRFIKKTNINAEAALLSNNEFSKFVGHKIAKSIVYMKKY
jgi:hypothetical protein